MEHGPNISATIPRFLEKTKIFGLRVNKDFLNRMQSVLMIFKKEIDKLGFTKAKILVLRDTIRVQRQATGWEKIFTIHISDKGLRLRICKELLQLNNKTTQ